MATGGSGARDRPVEDRPDVVVLELEAVEPAPLVGAGQLGGRPLDERDVPVAMACLDRARPRRRASSRSAANSRIVSSSRKRGSPSATSSTLSRLWSTSAISPSRMSPPELGRRAADRLGGLEVAAAGEDRQPIEQPPAAVVEQVVAPGDRAAQRLLAGRQVARAGGQDVELLLEPGEDRLGRQELDPRGGELDRERHAVQAGADRGDRRGVLVGDREAGPDRDGPLDEQPDGRVLAEGDGIDGARLAADSSCARARSAGSGPAASAGPGPGTPARRRRGGPPGW